MVLSLFMSRVLGMVRAMVINWQFGQNELTDAYRLSFMIPDLLFFLVAGGALSSAFIPVFSEYYHTDRKSEAWHVFSAVATIMSAAVLGFIGLAWVFAPQLTAIIAAKNDPALYPLITQMSRIVLPAQFAFFIGGLMMGTLYARQVFSVPGLAPNIYNIGIILGAVILPYFIVPGVVGMSWGALVGATCGSFILPLLAMRKFGMEFKITFDTKHPGVRKVFRLMAPVVFGLSLSTVFPMIMQYFAGSYGKSMNTAYDTANQLMQAPLGIFSQSLALAVFPALSQYVAEDHMNLYREQLMSTLRQVLYLTTPVAVIMFAVPDHLVRALFQHGKFTAVDTQRTAACLAMFAIGIVAWSLQPVLMRGYFAIHKSVTPVVIGTITTVFFFSACALITQAGAGYRALPLAGSLSAFLLVGALLVTLAKTVGGLDLAGLGVTLAKALAASSVCGLLLAGLMMGLGEISFGGRFGHIGLLFVAMCGFGWLYYYITRSLAMPECAYVERALKRIQRS